MIRKHFLILISISYKTVILHYTALLATLPNMIFSAAGSFGLGIAQILVTLLFSDFCFTRATLSHAFLLIPFLSVMILTQTEVGGHIWTQLKKAFSGKQSRTVYLTSPQMQLLKFVLYASCINQNRTHEHELRTQYWTAVHFFGLILTLNIVFFLSVHHPSSKVRLHLCLSIPSSTVFKAGGGRWECCVCTWQEWENWLSLVSHSVLTATVFWAKLNPVCRQSLKVLKNAWESEPPLTNENLDIPHFKQWGGDLMDHLLELAYTNFS